MLFGLLEEKNFMAHIAKEKLSESIQVNFNHSKEIAYWAKKYNITPEKFQKIFKENNYSIARTLAFCNDNFCAQ